MNRLHLATITFLLCLLGLSLFLYKVLALGFPLVPDSTSSLWTVEATVTFSSREKPVKVSLYIPRSDRFTAVMDENFISRGFGLNTTGKTLNRRALWAKRKSAGQQHLFYRAVIRKFEIDELSYALPPAKKVKPHFEGAYLAATESLVEQISNKSADTETFVRALLLLLGKREPDENARLLLGKRPDLAKQVVVAARILSVAGIAARTAHGIRLSEQLREAPIEHWIEVYDKKQWHLFAPLTAEVVPREEILVWWRGQRPLADIEGGGGLHVKLSVSRNQEEAIRSAIVRTHIASPKLLEYSLFSLPIQTQALYRVILLIPVGSLLIVVLRNVIGIKTFGTFMPVLIGLAFRETQLISGIFLFCLLAALGLGVRFYLEHLKLLLVPRLASVLCAVVLLMAALSILTHKLGIEHGLSLALFPMVIITMTIERMSITWEEVGSLPALKQGVGTLIAAAIIYLIVSEPILEHVVFVFPELLLVSLAMTILLGRYTGFRLMELIRFRELTNKTAG